MTFELKVLESYDDVPSKIQQGVQEALTADILERYDNENYHNQDIIHNTLQEYGYKLKDNQ